ncbi:type II toxin-antitoxin system death-on-curing family toxin [Salmonella enterica]
MKWVSAQEVIGIHDRLLARLAGVPGMPDPGRADAIIYRVQNRLHYEQVEDLFELAATYLIAIARGHIFNDGNKRTALAVSMLFLRRNGITLDVRGSVLDDLTVNAATGALLVDQVTQVLREQYHG